ncbi:MAG: ABC transporter substrate-binding protein, partial [Planctomycetota bacterium]|nr:ABC transporter substrate-binding protein [Planctomycetota bacterium]
IQEWTPNSNYAGAVLAKHKFAAPNGLEIEILPGSEQVDAVLEVVSGHAEFGDASADKVLMANLKGADLVVIGTVSQYSPTCFIALQGSGIRGPQDFVGKKVAVLTGTNTEKVYRMLLAKLGLPSPLPDEVEAPFDLTSFINGQYDVRPAFLYDEPVTLRQKGKEFTIINPLDYGVKFVGTVYFCRADTMAKKEPLVQKFINSVCDGWRFATRRPEEAITLIKTDWPEVDQTRELESLKEGMSSFVRKDGRLLSCVRADWQQMIADLSSLGGETADLVKIDLDKLINNSFVDRYYARVEK